MRITILTQGTRGDVQPCVALGVRLQRHSHKVKVASHQLFEPLVRDRGLDFALIGGDPSEWHKRTEWTQSRDLGLRWLNADSKRLIDRCRHDLDNLWQACQGADVILWVPLLVICARMAEVLGIPSIGINCYVTSPTRTFACPWLSGRWLKGPGIYNRQTWNFAHQLYWQLLRPTVNSWIQKNLDQPGFSWRGPYHEVVECKQVPMLYGFSPSLLPKPRDWPDWLHVTGYWFLEPPVDWQPPADLVRFLDAGTPPVYIGFGSNASDQPERITELVLKALKLSGQRGVLDIGWGSMDTHSGFSDLNVKFKQQDGNVFWINGAHDWLHDWLFPQLAGVIHHGGAGITPAGVRMGVPTATVPTFGDQFVWGRQILDLGLGAAPIPKNHLTAERLATAIDTLVNDESIRTKSRDFGQKLQAEDGLSNAVELFHSYIENWQNKS